MSLVWSDVSRETQERLEIYERELTRWNKKINLVSPNSIATMRQRHFLDSLQLAHFAAAHDGKWLDLGSGGGFPGLVISAHQPDRDIHLVESDLRKSLFLTTTAKLMDVSVTVHNTRSEELAPQQAQIISARAFAPLVRLLDHAFRHKASNTICILPKGQSVRDELTEAQKHWTLSYELHPSETDEAASILIIKDFTRV